MELIDSHCHFDFEAFDNDRLDQWSQAKEKGLAGLVIPGVNETQWRSASLICQQFDHTVMAAGLHPWWVEQGHSQPRAIATLMQRIAKQQDLSHCVAIGECGLDAHIDIPMDWQHTVFEAQLQLACELQRPLIIHIRKAHQTLIALLKHYAPSQGGVIHGFTGSKELAEQYWQRGFYLGIGGSITYPRANKTRSAIAAMPLEALLLETDAPDMPLHGQQGQRNSPVYLRDIAHCLAELKQLPVESIAQHTTANSQQLFGDF